MMTLSKEQLSIFQAHINAVASECPLCRGRKWTMFGDGVFTIPASLPTSVAPTQIPLVPVTCLICGNTIFINPGAAGCFKKKEETADAGESKG